MGRAPSLALFVALGIACGGDELAEERSAARAGGSAIDASEAPSAGDPLLARARAQIEHGRLPAAVRDEIMRSDAPAHARARRILAALEAIEAEPPVTPAPPAAPPADAAAPAQSAAPTRPQSVPVTAPVAEPGIEDTASTPTQPRAAVPKARPTLQKLALKSQANGAVLDLVADRGVLVGVVHQREQGIVRLVLDGVSASAKVLAARPSITGARVTSIESGPKALRITLTLEPGWTFEGVKKTATGARVRLSADGHR